MTVHSAPSLLRGGAFDNSSAARTPSALDAVRARLAELGRSISEWAETEAAIRHLQSLDDRQLADLGIARSEITSKVRTGR